MKSKLLFIATLFFALQTQAGWTTKSFTFGGKTRQYKQYVSSNYNSSNPAAIVIALHGLGDNMTNFSGIGMAAIADTANFIFLVPQAWSDPLAGTAWNSGAGSFGYYPNATINDVGFINAMVDTTAANFSVNLAKIYVCGFSMGGFMTERMACEANWKFAAFASVSGTIGDHVTCNPDRAISIAHFHGTADSTVSFAGNTIGMDAEPLVAYWVGNDNCDTIPQQTTFPDDVNDGKTIDHFIYANGSNNSEVEFFKVNGGAHEWLFTPQNDISYSVEIWKFFSKHTLQAPLGIENESENKLTLFPNPSTEEIFVSGISSPFIRITDMFGQTVFEGETSSSFFVKQLQAGIYSVLIFDKAGKLVATKRLLKK